MQLSFSSPVVKAAQRRMDGLLEPVEPGYKRYFLEVQGYLDEAIYWRTVNQIGLYYEQRPSLNGSDWQAVLLFLDKSYDPGPRTLGPMYQDDLPWLVRGLLPDLLKQAQNVSPILNVLRPLAVEDETEIQEQAAEWTAAIRQSPELDATTQARLLDILV
ncbi:MAG: DUF2887 domain-containing protein, partial [Chloroflexota bacterium]